MKWHFTDKCRERLADIKSGKIKESETRSKEEIEKEKAEQARLEAKQKEIDGILSTMEMSGVTIDDLREGVQPKKEKKAKTPKNKVPPKYKLVDDDGEEHLWTGRGSMPLVFKHAINEQGKALATFEIK